MGIRTRRAAVALASAILATGAWALGPPSPAGAAPQPFQLDLVEGELQIRDAEEPYALGQPTTIGGQHDTGDGGTGAVTAGTFSSPPISFETEALGQPVFVDATFSQVSPGTGTGSIDAEGNVAFRTQLTVDLHIEVNDPPILVQECQATPVSIALDSTAPWDPGTGRVTLSDPDFTVPPVTVTDDCISLVAGNVNDLLAGSGHALTMTMEGDLDLPPPAGCPTTTDLAVTPERSLLGEAITLDATVTPAPDGSEECADAAGAVPAGTVELRSGSQVIGVADLDAEGEASLVTDDLPTGTAALTARYRGQPPYSASTSDPVAHVVSARPSIEADVPAAIVIGAEPTEVDVTISSSGVGAEVVNARLDVTFRRTDSFLGLSPDELAVERRVGDTWVPVPLASLSPHGALMDSTGVPLAVGEVRTERIRIAATDLASPKPISVTFEVVEVDPATGAPAPSASPAPGAIASATVASALAEDDRRPTTIALDALSPHTLRRGMTVRADALIQTAPGGPEPTGTYEVLLDGAPVPIRSDRTPPELGYQPSIPTRTPDGFNSPELVVPTDHPTGTRQVTVRYSGDAFYAPSQVTRPLVVLADRGPTYDCINSNLFFDDRFTVNVDAFARVPEAVVPGTPRPLAQLDVEVYADRGDAVNSFGGFFGPTTPVVPEGSSDDGITALDLDFGDLGSGTARAMTIEGNIPMGPDTLPEDPNPDMVIGFDGESASISVTGAPGAVVPVELEGFTIAARLFGGFPFELSCTPLDEADRLGSVVVGGTTLTVEAPQPTREGDAVTLRAQVAPAGVAGTVEFLDGDTVVAVATVGSDGVATVTTDDLAVGTRSLTARFRTGSVALRSTSAPVELVVLPAVECPPASSSEEAATVRLMYLSILGRCPSADEATFWSGRLAGGASQASVARSIATGPEAVGQLVEAGYQRVLDRAADTDGKAFWVGRLRAGYRYDRFLASLGASPELAAAGGDDEGFVTLLYERVLERSPDPSGLAYWVDQLEAGVPRWRVALSFTGVEEVRRRLVVTAYEDVLGRAPTAGELSAATAQLRADGDLALVHARLAGTPEFAERAQELPNPTDP